jgi:hypothetical protein
MSGGTFRVAPNPANEILTISQAIPQDYTSAEETSFSSGADMTHEWRKSLEHNASAYDVKIYNNQGHRVKLFTNKIGEFKMDTSDLLSGLYHLHIISGSEIQRISVFIAH